MTQHDLNKLLRLAEKQKNQRTAKIESRILKQTHDIKLAENLSINTKKLKKLKNLLKN